MFDDGFIKAVQLKSEDTGSGINFKAIMAKYTTKETWNDLTEDQQLTYFDTNGTGGTVATSETADGYGIKNISINNGDVIEGVIDTTTGITLDYPSYGYFGVRCCRDLVSCR